MFPLDGIAPLGLSVARRSRFPRRCDMSSEKTTLPYTGKEFLESLDDGREVWIYGERVKNITTHPAFQNCARMLARLYDALHEDHRSGQGVLTEPTEWGGFTHRYFRAPTTVGSRSPAATPSRRGRASPTAGWGAPPITRRPSWARW